MHMYNWIFVLFTKYLNIVTTLQQASGFWEEDGAVSAETWNNTNIQLYICI